MADPSDEGLFDELLNNRGVEWFKKMLAEHSKPTEASGGFLGFLETSLKEANSENRKLRSKLEAAFDLLTPEQKTQLRSVKSAVEDDPGNNPPKEPPPTPPTPLPEPAKKKGLFNRL